MVHEKAGPDFIEVSLEPGEGATADGHHAVLVAFALANLESPSLTV
jgi:glutamate formiminotransferase